MPIKTYLDSGVIVAIARTRKDIAAKALAVLNDPDREFYCSAYTRLELLPLPTFYGKQDELAIINAYLAIATELPHDPALLPVAMIEACTTGLGAVDALHVVYAHAAGVDELVTAEKGSKNINKTRRVKVTSLRP